MSEPNDKKSFSLQVDKSSSNRWDDYLSDNSHNLKKNENLSLIKELNDKINQFKALKDNKNFLKDVNKIVAASKALNKAHELPLSELFDVLSKDAFSLGVFNIIFLSAATSKSNNFVYSLKTSDVKENNNLYERVLEKNIEILTNKTNQIPDDFSLTFSDIAEKYASHYIRYGNDISDIKLALDFSDSSFKALMLRATSSKSDKFYSEGPTVDLNNSLFNHKKRLFLELFSPSGLIKDNYNYNQKVFNSLFDSSLWVKTTPVYSDNDSLMSAFLHCHSFDGMLSHLPVSKLVNLIEYINNSSEDAYKGLSLIASSSLFKSEHIFDFNQCYDGHPFFENSWPKTELDSSSYSKAILDFSVKNLKLNLAKSSKNKKETNENQLSGWNDGYSKFTSRQQEASKLTSEFITILKDFEEKKSSTEGSVKNKRLEFAGKVNKIYSLSDFEANLINKQLHPVELFMLSDNEFKLYLLGNQSGRVILKSILEEQHAPVFVTSLVNSLFNSGQVLFDNGGSGSNYLLNLLDLMPKSYNEHCSLQLFTIDYIDKLCEQNNHSNFVSRRQQFITTTIGAFSEKLSECADADKLADRLLNLLENNAGLFSETEKNSFMNSIMSSLPSSKRNQINNNKPKKII